jgi:electron transfer flavoprotein beta subunit
MKIVVCLKQVPGTTEVKIDPETNTLIRQGIENIINPFDTYALEEAVRLKEKHGGTVTVVTMGPPQADAALREAVSLGADEVILLSDRAFGGADTWATGYTLSLAVRKIGDADLVILGKQTLDGDTGQVGPEMAEMLEFPFVAYVSEVIAAGDGKIKVRRLTEEGHEIIEAGLPAVITVSKEINVPRMPSLRGKMKAKSIAITTWDKLALAAEDENVGRNGSPTRVIEIFFPKRVHQAEMLTGTTGEKVEKLVDRLREAKVC